MDVIRSFSFPGTARVRKGAEYDRVFKKGRNSSTPHFRILVAPAEGETSRLGLVVSRKAARRAHDRNRIKRLLREYFRLNRHRLAITADIVVLAKTGAAGIGFSELKEELERALMPWFAA